MRFIAVTLAGVVLVAAATAGEPTAQAFDVVSITRNGGDTLASGVRTALDGTTILTNHSVASLLLRARVSPELPRNIENLPDWASNRYDVTVKGPAGAIVTPEVWRDLLAERFKLLAHVERREKQGFALVLSRTADAVGRNLKPSTLACLMDSPVAIPAPPAAQERTRKPHWPTRQEAASGCGFLSSPGSGFVVSGGMPMEWLAGTVGGLIGEPFMVDKTGLTGLYAVELDFPPTQRSAGATAPDRAEVLKAIQQQLGLTVQRATVPVSVLVIDHIERPTEN